MTPLVRGGLNLLWKQEGKYLFLESRNDGAIHLYYDLDGSKWEAVRPVNDPELNINLTSAFLKFWGTNLSYIAMHARSASAVPIAM